MGATESLGGATDREVADVLARRLFNEELATTIGHRVLALSGVTHPDIQQIIDEEMVNHPDQQQAEIRRQEAGNRAGPSLSEFVH